MHAMRLLEKWLQRNAIIGHQARVGALVRVVGALLSGGRLALTDSRASPCGACLRQTPHQGRGPAAGQLAPESANETVSIAPWRARCWEGSRDR